MTVTIDVTVACTIEDAFEVMRLARAEVEEAKPVEERAKFYPESPTDAVKLLIRTAIAAKLLPLEAVTLHEINHEVRNMDLPL